MLGYFDFLFLSYSGRIGRLNYWLATLALAVIQFAAMWGLLMLAHGALAPMQGNSAAMKAAIFSHVLVPFAIVAVLFLYPTYAVVTKRWHDRGKSGWWSLIGFVPIIGGLWFLIEVGFLAGEDGANAYGVR